MKFTKTAFRTALKENNQTLVWKLTAIKVGRRPTRNDVYELICEVADTKRDLDKAGTFAYDSLHKRAREHAWVLAWNARGAYAQYNIHYYRAKALEMLRRLYTEPLTNYTKIAHFGHTNLYFCSPIYGHGDYNKVCTCPLNGPLATDAHGNKYDPQAAWCSKVLDLSNRIYGKKRDAYNQAV